jgi:F0F1-type ATP synthase delta subunit
VLGGMVVRVGDTVYDSSLANRLDRQRQITIKKSVARLQQSGT